ncbi:DNA-packaging protein [Thalassobaculum salexigens]|uniref:DNA-packaging protein n=1 Tax=Thalassobaculum salexigens TaxID=455360 RepID=UPI00248D7CCB|nr:terminase family protein [Thalassobaculum salexigens]
MRALIRVRGTGPTAARTLLEGLTDRDAAHLLHDWPLWARDKQLPPQGDWRVWLILAGRGFGKTRTGAEWVRALAESQRAGRIALVGETASDARDVMVEGESGLLACCPPWARPLYEPSKRRVTWPNGAMATCFSADDPDQLRGPQFDAAWADEIAKWRYEAAWDNLMLGLRLGLDPRFVATTTPKPRAWLSRLMADPRTMVTRGGTRENAANLAPAFLDQILARYDGTRLGRQEIEGEYLVDTPGALWTRALLAASRADGAVPDLARIVVAVDPAVTSGAESDETGIVVAGRDAANGFWVLEDLTARLSPDLWARRAVEAYGRHRADAVVCEVNQGGDLVAATLRTVDPSLPVRAVRATRGKRLRAEPIAALYEQGRVRHAGAFPEMEDQMTGFTGASGEASPDRLDALVWALTDLMSGPRAAESREFLV